MPLLLQYFMNSINLTLHNCRIDKPHKRKHYAFIICDVNYSMMQLCYYAMHNMVIYFHIFVSV